MTRGKRIEINPIDDAMDDRYEKLEYTIPEDIKQSITKEFLTAFVIELKNVFSDINLCMDDYSEFSGTFGWHKAFHLACLKNDKEKLYFYYDSLQWWESDMFDGDIEKLMIEYKSLR